MNISADFLKFVDKSNKAQTVEELFEHLLAFASKIGYDQILYSPMVGSGRSNNCPKYWRRNELEENREDSEPGRPQQVCLLERAYHLSTVKQQIIDKAVEEKQLAGIAIFLFTADGETVVLGFSSSNGNIEVDKNRLSLLHASAQQFGLVYKGLISSEIATQYVNINLTPREQEVLSWTASGKSNCEMAEIMAISGHCIDFHLRNIYKKLNVSTRIAAVVKAIRLGLIVPI